MVKVLGETPAPVDDAEALRILDELTASGEYDPVELRDVLDRDGLLELERLDREDGLI